MTLQFSNGQSFKQIASDGGLLHEPVELTEITLTPAERAEVVVDFSNIGEEEEISLNMKDNVVLLPFEIKGEPKETVQETSIPNASSVRKKLICH